MKTKFEFRSSDLPVVIAGLVILIGVFAWFKVQSATKRDLITTRITLATLQQGLLEYQDEFNHLPPLHGSGSPLHQFLVDYQIARLSDHHADNFMREPNITHFIRPANMVLGTIRLPDGRTFRGLVNVKDGFGNSIRYLPTQAITWRAPCFASVPPGAVNSRDWIFSR